MMNDTLPEAEVVARQDAALRRALATPPQRQQPIGEERVGPIEKRYSAATR